jgi:hypothetical protein
MIRSVMLLWHVLSSYIDGFVQSMSTAYPPHAAGGTGVAAGRYVCSEHANEYPNSGVRTSNPHQVWYAMML